MRARLEPLLVAAAMLAAGCLGGSADGGGSEGTDPAEASADPLVVALLDSGVDPYHAVFADGRDWSGRLPPGATPVHLAAEGSYEERLRADGPTWASLEPGRLYWFVGTRLLAVSVVDGAEPPVLDAVEHGTATASVAARAAPDVLLLMVQVDARSCLLGGDPRCGIDPSVARGMEWAAAQPWIDVISTSIALPGNVHDPEALHPEARAYVEASRRAHEAGKLVLNAAGNTATPTLADYLSGPPWVVAVGGAEPHPHGRALTSSHGTDVVSDYTWQVADAGTLDGWSWAGGTSFAAPSVAGTLAAALGLLGEPATPDLAPRLRQAMNLSARPFDAAGWDPTRPTANDTMRALFSQSVPVVAHGPQAGWGYVGPDAAAEIARRVAQGDAGMTEQQEEVARQQAAWQSLRERAWP